MLELVLYISIGIAFFLFLADYLNRYFFPKNDLYIPGKLIWVDRGKDTKPFFNSTFKVFGKPDLMYAVRGGALAVEYKSRYGTIYESDIAQAKCAALAARGEGYKVVKILLKTSTQKRYISLPKNDKALFDEIKNFVIVARKAKSGSSLRGTPENKKCKSCAYKHDCSYV